jgi:hypothetical protein
MLHFTPLHFLLRVGEACLLDVPCQLSLPSSERCCCLVSYRFFCLRSHGSRQPSDFRKQCTSWAYESRLAVLLILRLIPKAEFQYLIYSYNDSNMKLNFYFWNIVLLDPIQSYMKPVWNPFYLRSGFIFLPSRTVSPKFSLLSSPTDVYSYYFCLIIVLCIVLVMITFKYWEKVQYMNRKGWYFLTFSIPQVCRH